MEDSLTIRLDEVEQEIVRILSLRSDNLQIFSSRQDQILQSHYHSLSSTLQTAQVHLEKVKVPVSGFSDKTEVNERWNERQNLKRFWVYCEDQRLKLFESSSSHKTSTDASDTVYQTPFQNPSSTSLSKLSDLSLS